MGKYEIKLNASRINIGHINLYNDKNGLYVLNDKYDFSNLINYYTTYFDIYPEKYTEKGIYFENDKMKDGKNREITRYIDKFYNPWKWVLQYNLLPELRMESMFTNLNLDFDYI